MEGKLIKQEEKYYALYTNKGIFVSDVNGGSLANRLSLKNCEAIVNGYDLDDLVRAFIDVDFYEDEGFDDILTSKEEMFIRLSYIRGFQKALSILGDKKFSKTELYRAFLINSEGNNTTLENTFKEIVLPMFQQTEWDCTFNPDEKDSKGCLILKRK